MIGELGAALDGRGSAVLVAPPGTGKTTGVPPALLERPWARGRIILVVPRRMAARAAAARMSHDHGEPVGRRFGYSVRHDRRVGPATLVEAVTPGMLLRRLQADPGLDGTCAVLLDEFHERSVDLDLLLALLTDVRSSLRPDLRLLVMSATLEASRVANVLADDGAGSPVIRVEAELHPIRTLHRPGSAHDRLDQRVAQVVFEAARDTEGDILVFLPGRGEIAATARRLRNRLGSGIEVLELHGSTPPAAQDEILAPRGDRSRRVMLSTSVAETSVTVPGVRVVVDSGRRRSQQVDSRTGLPGLVTRAVSRAGADQRRGRCGREGPGVCFRLWSPAEDELRRVADPPEVTVADLSAPLLQILDWGASSALELRWVDPPPAAGLQRASELLVDLGAVSSHGRLTELGHRMADLGFHPRLGAIAVRGQDRGLPAVAAAVVAVLDAGGGDTSEISDAVRGLRSDGNGTSRQRAYRQWRRRLGASGPPEETDDLDRAVAQLVLAGYADRLGRRRPERPDVYHLRHGGEVQVRRSAGGLGEAEWIVAVEVDARTGSGRPGALHLGVAVHPEDVSELLERAERNGLVREDPGVDWDPDTGAVAATLTRRLDAVVLDRLRWRSPDPESVAAAVVGVVRRDGPSVFANWEEVGEFRARIAMLEAVGAARPSDPEGGWPDVSEEALAANATEWVPTVVAAALRDGRFAPSGAQLRDALAAQLSWEDVRALDSEAPTRWPEPSGPGIRLRYGEIDGEPASVLMAVKLQRLLGVDGHPSIGRQRTPIVVELLSPAGRPVQRTLDLPGFWRGSYAQVRAEMRGRYPKHSWPERPWEASNRP